MISRSFGAALIVFCTAIRPVFAEPTRWSVDLAHSRLGFVATQAGAEFAGQFHKFSADIVFSPDDLEHSLIDVEIDILSVDTQSRDRDSMLPNADWFHASVFPKARFLADRFVAKGDGNYEAHAALTMRDIGRDVVLPFKLIIEDDPSHSERKRAIVSGQLVLLRTAWGIGQGEWANTGTVGDKVVVTIELTAVQGAIQGD